MNEIEAIIQTINSCGFPIACVIAMFFMWNKEREEHKEEMTKCVEAINNNTRVIEQLSERMK